MTRRALLVDDDPEAAAGLTFLLKDLGWEVRLAETAREAYEGFASFSPDIVLLDVELPDASGIDVLQQLKVRSPSTPIIMISGAGTIARAVESMRLGAETFLQKPFDSDALAAALVQAVPSIVTRRALLVDDDPDVAASVEMMLEEMGWDVRRAESADDAYVAFAAFTPNMVLLDVELRHASGIDVLRKLKAGSPATPVIMISGGGTVDRVVESMKLGAATFLQKPFDAGALAMALEQATASVPGPGRQTSAATRAFQCIRCHAEIDRAVTACPHCNEPVTDFLRRHSDEPIDGKYRVVERLGAGGMGEVYRVVHTILGSNRVIKVIHPQISGTDKARERFLREAMVATKMSQSNLATLYDFSELPDGSHYMVWEFIDGQNLAELMASQGTLPVRYAIGLTLQALAGLDAIHRAGIVHRDISPDNLMITRDSDDEVRLKIIDFGIVKEEEEGYAATSPGMFIGKLRYASPDQLGFLPKGAQIDARADLYSLAVILYEMVTGKPPFEAASMQQYIRHHSRTAPVSLDLSAVRGGEQLRPVLTRALERDRNKRYSSAREFSRALQDVVSSLPASEPDFVATGEFRHAAIEPRETRPVRIEPSTTPHEPPTYVDRSTSPSNDEALRFLRQQVRGVRQVSLETSGDSRLAKQLAELLHDGHIAIAENSEIVIRFHGIVTEVARGRSLCTAQASVVKAFTEIFRYELAPEDYRVRDSPAKRFARVLRNAFGK